MKTGAIARVVIRGGGGAPYGVAVHGKDASLRNFQPMSDGAGRWIYATCERKMISIFP